MDVSNLKQDAAKIEAGQWVSDIPKMDNVRLRVRGLSSPLVATHRSRKERRAPKQDRERDGTLKPEAAMRILGETLYEVVLLDWDGFTNNGEPVPYDAELAAAWCTDPNYRQFADAVVYAANVVDNGGEDLKEGVVKNSSTPSSGTSSGAPEPTA